MNVDPGRPEGDWTVTTIDLDALEQRLAEATPRPWAVDADTLSVWCANPDDGSGGTIFDVGDPYPRGANAPIENCELAAAAVNALPDLIAELRASRRVAEAADTARHLRRNFSHESAEQERAWRELDAAMTELEALK